MKLILALFMSCAAVAKAEPKAYHLSLNLARLPYQRDLLFPSQHYWDSETRLRWDVGWSRWFMDNVVTGRTLNSRYRYVGWEFETGFNLMPGLDVMWHHNSQNANDLDRSKFPVLDAYGFRLTFIDEKRP